MVSHKAKEEDSARIRLVRTLVERAFGEGTLSNIGFESGWVRTDDLEQIMVPKRMRIFGMSLPEIFRGYRWAGQFVGNDGRLIYADGSYIRVHPKWEPQARKYAELFENATNQKVRLEVQKELYW